MYIVYIFAMLFLRAAKVETDPELRLHMAALRVVVLTLTDRP